MAYQCKFQKLILFLTLGLFALKSYSQDTLKLNEVTIHSYPLTHSEFNHPSSAVSIDEDVLRTNEDESFIKSVNHIPGIRMEERSPGSYRFSIRGSLLRSPFGVRNIKFYIDDFPFTDGGGNTYLNLLDKNFFNNVEIIKGPDGSFFGANTGGCVMMNSIESADSTTGNVMAGLASYHTYSAEADIALHNKNSTGKILLSDFTADGYRENSSVDRLNLSLSEKIKYSQFNELGIFVLLGKLDYQTPGGLTLSQAVSNPQQARPSTATAPGALAQKAGIKNKTVFAGISNLFSSGGKGSDKLILSFSGTDFRNPFLTNYETRDEKTFSLRNIYKSSAIISSRQLQWTVSVESQLMNSTVSDYGNRKGEKDTLQSSDRIQYINSFISGGISYPVLARLVAEASASVNYADVNFHPADIPGFTKRDFPLQVMPRFAMLYSFTDNFNCRMTASRGYSTPTLEEIKPSFSVFTTSIYPESGWNYEFGIRARTTDERIKLNASLFYFNLTNAIVRKVNAEGNDVYVNAGSTNQTGLEASLIFFIIRKKNDGMIRNIFLDASFTKNAFTFGNYKVDGQNYSGNKITGVPANILSDILSVEFPLSVSVRGEHYYSDILPLNDANTDYARAYNIFNASVRKEFRMKKINCSVTFGIRNITNEFYSAGNDLNAFGKRYYNPSPLRNYFGMAEIRF
jgi:iron complex outermembrane receptor protein